MTSIAKTSRLLSPAETAERLNVSLKTIYRLIKSGKLTAIRLERTLRVAPADLDAFLHQSRTAKD